MILDTAENRSVPDSFELVAARAFETVSRLPYLPKWQHHHHYCHHHHNHYWHWNWNWCWNDVKTTSWKLKLYCKFNRELYRRSHWCGYGNTSIQCGRGKFVVPGNEWKLFGAGVPLRIPYIELTSTPLQPH